MEKPEQSNTDVYFKGRRCHFHYANVMAKEWYSNGNQPNNKGSYLYLFQ